MSAYDIFPTLDDAKQRVRPLHEAYTGLCDAFAAFDLAADRMLNATTSLDEVDRSYIAEFRLNIDTARNLVEAENLKVDVIEGMIDQALGVLVDEEEE